MLRHAGRTSLALVETYFQCINGDTDDRRTDEDSDHGERPESGRRDRTDTTYSRNSAPLHFVSPNKNSEAVKVLLEDPRIDPSMTDEKGFTVKLILFRIKTLSRRTNSNSNPRRQGRHDTV